ncbi:MAG: hypothetical protein HUU55_03855 [Myxococcales bacterium]|nr:hypothetical protein [Myxococcales bacterium]
MKIFYLTAFVLAVVVPPLAEGGCQAQLSPGQTPHWRPISKQKLWFFSAKQPTANHVEPSVITTQFQLEAAEPNTQEGV